MIAVDFTGNHGLAVRLVIPEGGATAGVVHEFFRLQADGVWLKDDLGGIQSGFVAMDLALDTTGKSVLAGLQMPGPPSVVLDLRGPQAEYIEQSSYGMLASARTHLGLEKDGPEPRSVEPPDSRKIQAEPMVGGLHHRYYRQAA